ncbi:MAG: S-layer homology domain-containing protein, partial [Oscillospiraceae bacterium]|nr:S-layer homology domain-containing protein [Oscillospiraceae bacterium]
MKRFLALTIAVMMIISGMALNVSANTTFSDVEDNALGEAINILAELELVLGNNGKFNGEDTLTRQEFALFVARIHSARPEWFVGSGAPTTFADDAEIALWAKTAVQYCYDNGIVNGIGGNRFGPERDVLMQEAVAMLVRSLGYTGLVYPFGELSVAAQVKDTARDLGDVALIGIGVDPELDIESKLFADGSFSPTDPLTRNAMAALL